MKRIFVFFAFLAFSVLLGGVALSVKALQSETWVINETPSVLFYNTIFNINFISNNNNYDRIVFDPDDDMSHQIVYAGAGDLFYTVYYGLNWYDEAYRTVTFETAPTGDLLTWLQVNAEKVDEELIGYRPLVDGDIDKKFGVELDTKIYFASGLSVPIYENNTVLVDWVFPDFPYMFELRATPLMFDGNNLYERFIYFQGGNLVGEVNVMTTYSYIYDINDETDSYFITDYTLPLLSYVNEIYYDYAKNLILVKDLSLTDEEIGYINGYEDGKSDYGGFLDGQWFTAEDFGAWEYNRGLSDSIDVVGVMVGGVFSSLTALGNVEVLPGLKIFYIVGIFVVFGVVGFIIQKKFGGDD